LRPVNTLKNRQRRAFYLDSGAAPFLYRRRGYYFWRLIHEKIRYHSGHCGWFGIGQLCWWQLGKRQQLCKSLPSRTVLYHKLRLQQQRLRSPRLQACLPPCVSAGLQTCLQPLPLIGKR
jgi:hypothetical protein